MVAVVCEGERRSFQQEHLHATSAQRRDERLHAVE
jgi:hypothetical protein